MTIAGRPLRLMGAVLAGAAVLVLAACDDDPPAGQETSHSAHEGTPTAPDRTPMRTPTRTGGHRTPPPNCPTGGGDLVGAACPSFVNSAITTSGGITGPPQATTVPGSPTPAPPTVDPSTPPSSQSITTSQS
ncbi:hypothetical protein FAF44_43435, partial [Nonomuraea sp. MG754425]|nr:hypothetical protein [Nonomuraea sp. MG754425]